MNKIKHIDNGSIDESYKNVELLKIYLIFCIHLAPFLILYLLFYIITLDLDIFIWSFLIPYIFYLLPDLMIILYLYFYYRKFIAKYNYTIEENQIIINRGVNTRKSICIPYKDIQGISISSGFFEKSRHIYSINFETPGDKNIHTLVRIILSIVLIIIYLIFILVFLSFIELLSFWISFPLVILVVFIKTEKNIPGLKEPEILRKMIDDKRNNIQNTQEEYRNNSVRSEDLAYDEFIGSLLSRIDEGGEIKSFLKKIRENKGLTISDLAKKINVSIKTIQYLEEGRFSPSIVLAYKIAEALNCEVEDLFSL